MTTIYLVRHGQDEDNNNGILNGHRNKPLTKKGIKQANHLSELIAGQAIQFDTIYSSPLRRAYGTACIVASQVGGSYPQIMESLIERDFGVMTGKSHTKIIELCAPDIIDSGHVTYFLSPDKSETFPDLIRRAHSVIKTVESTHPDSTVLLVSHGDFGKMSYTTYYKLDRKQVLTDFYFGNADMLALSKKHSPKNCQIFKISHNETANQKFGKN